MHRRPGWLLDEVASAGRENLDAGHASRYDSKEDAGAAAEVTMLTRLGLAGESVVIDLGAGTGQFTLAVAPLCEQVVAVDVSSVMLDVLRAKVNLARLINVEIAHAGFLTYAHRGRPAARPTAAGPVVSSRSTSATSTPRSVGSSRR
jgi:SAM-dependent methyltransferase